MSDIAAWLKNLGLSKYASVFVDNDIDFEVLPNLTEQHLDRLGVSLGHQIKLLEAIAALEVEKPDTVQVMVSTDESVVPPAHSSQAERRQLTVMFVDLVGSTELSGQLDPEDLSVIIRRYQDTVSGEINRLEGFVAKFMGDGVLAYFGWPRAHEDEAERAVRAGLAVSAAVEKLRTPDGVALAARIGIATGLVVVGDLIGEGAAQEEAVVGETPNLAARLQALAEPGSVIISDVTRRRLGGFFELQALTAQRLKGIADPVDAYRVLGERPAESRFQAQHASGVLPLIGREHELAQLLERWRQAAHGEGQMVLVSGEAGSANRACCAHWAMRLAASRITGSATSARRITATARCIRPSSSSAGRRDSKPAIVLIPNSINSKPCSGRHRQTPVKAHASLPGCWISTANRATANLN